MRYRRILACVLSLWLLPSLVLAGTTGKLAGTVTDASTGKPLPYVNIIVEGTTRGSATDANGEFFVIGVPAGTWTIRASMIGYADYVEMNVPVSVDLTTALDFELSPQALIVGDEVVVVAVRKLIRKDETQSMRTTSREQLAVLPVTTFQEVLSSNTSTQGQNLNLHVRGGRSGEATVLIDGMNVTEPQFRQANLDIGREALAEMQLLSGGFNAEYGNAQSGVIILTTRQGNPVSYSGKIMYATDDIADDGLTEASQNFDYFEVSVGGPEPITSKLLPRLGVKIPGTLTFFLQGDATFRDRSAFHSDAFENTRTKLSSEQLRWWNDTQTGDPKLDIAIGRTPLTSEELLPGNLLDDLFGFGKRERQWINANIKLAYSPKPAYSFTFSHRVSNKDRNYFHFSQGNDLARTIEMAQALGIDDGIDNDGDGRIDEEIFNGIDDDGDGYIDELDATLVDPANFEGEAMNGFDLSWGVDRDQDGLVDEEAWNGIDDDGDGLIDEDLQPYLYNGWDFMYKQQNEDDQQVLTWKHVVGKGSTFYEVKLSRLRNMRAWLPKRGKDGVSASDIDELREWLDEYEGYYDALDVYYKAIDEGDSTAVEPEAPDPYLGMGFVQEQYTDGEPYVDTNANGSYDEGEPFTDWSEDGVYTGPDFRYNSWEPFVDTNDNDMWDYFNPPETNKTLWLSGANNPFRGLCYYGVSGYTTGIDPSFYRSGADFRESKTYTLKVDVTSQVSKHHQIKSGLEGKYYDLMNWSRQILAGDDGEGLFPNDYRFYPHTGALYVQDKMEYESAIVNMGLRVDYFNPGDKSDPLGLDAQTGIARKGEDAPDPSWSVLPRFGISFPVTDRDVFHFFYGHFFQQPRLFDIFNKLNQVITSANDIIGNPFLDPEETISYEFGVKHQMGLNSLMTVTAFFKDIDNLAQIDKVFEEETNLVYHTRLNSSYGTVRGFEVSASHRNFYNLSGEFSYTYQVATTTHSSSRDTYEGYEQFQLLPGKEYPAGWDRRHAFSFNAAYALGEDEGPEFGGFYPLADMSVSLLGQVGSGLPYTPTSSNDSPLYEFTNTERFPWIHKWDLRALKKLRVAGLRWGLQLDVYNMFNSMNALAPDEQAGASTDYVDAYRDRIGYTNRSGGSNLRNYGGFDNSLPHPNAWDIGRRVRLGVSLEF